jgi:hypothetical protein
MLCLRTQRFSIGLHRGLHAADRGCRSSIDAIPERAYDLPRLALLPRMMMHSARNLYAYAHYYCYGWNTARFSFFTIIHGSPALNPSGFLIIAYIHIYPLRRWGGKANGRGEFSGLLHERSGLMAGRVLLG